MDLLLILTILCGWGLLALFLLLAAVARAQRVNIPIPREKARVVNCRRCNLPFQRTSWRCGRCGAFMKPSLLYLVGRFLLEPLLAVIVLPWVMLFGGILAGKLWFAKNFAPVFTPFFERLSSRLGVWVTPLFGRWVPGRWQIPTTGTRLAPAEVDVPPDVLIASLLTLATSLPEEAGEEVVVRIPSPSEETLSMLRQSPEGIREVYGYVPNGRPLVPTYSDRIIAADISGSELLEYAEGIADHLDEPLRQVVVTPLRRSGEGPVSSWSFLLVREPSDSERYPVRCELLAGPETVQKVRRRLAELSQWNTLPCDIVLA